MTEKLGTMTEAEGVNDEEILLKVEGLFKSFGPTKAVIDMHLEVKPGEIRGLIGENGSGKSTVTSMIAGCLKPDAGNMYMNGKPHAPRNMLEGRSAGVCMLLQEKGTIDHLTISENVFLGQESQFAVCGIINRHRMDDATKKILEKIGLTEVDPSHPIDELSFEDRKLVETGMAMKENPKILIVDETTTALSQKGRDMIYSIMREMKDNKSSVIFISHDLEELKKVCDSVTVMRDGGYVTTLYKDQITLDAMRQNMIGRDLSGKYYRTDYDDNYDHDVVMLKAENISLGNRLKSVSLEIHKGEILGIGGLTDCGMHDLCKVLYGLEKPDSGTVTLPQKNTVITNSTEAVKNGMGYVPKDRELEGLMMASSIKHNIVMMSLNKLKKGIFITPPSENKLSMEQVESLSIKMGGLSLPVSSLSGGNKQKVSIAKCTANDVQILLMDCPTRGIDIGVKAAIYRLLEQFKKEGRAILMISEELPELIGMSDNLIIMKDGEISGHIKRSAAVTEHNIITKMI
jgi:ribose transport system ATP-binding protein